MRNNRKKVGSEKHSKMRASASEDVLNEKKGYLIFRRWTHLQQGDREMTPLGKAQRGCLHKHTPVPNTIVSFPMIWNLDT